MFFEKVKDLDQGTQFTYIDELVLKLPNHVECYGEPANVISIKTGTMMWIDPELYVDLSTMKTLG